MPTELIKLSCQRRPTGTVDLCYWALGKNLEQALGFNEKLMVRMGSLDNGNKFPSENTLSVFCMTSI